jgi:hypothetical protein
MIYVHGWQVDSSKAHFRESFSWTDTGENMGDAWVEDGWNIGIFYRNQLADEPYSWQAESKIWMPYGEEGMNWRTEDENHYLGDDDADGFSAAGLFGQAYLDALIDQDFSQEMRIAGHSLGTQMAVNMSWMILQEEPSMVPHRIALLDPAFSAGRVEYLRDNSGYAEYTGERVNQYVLS